MNGYTCADVWAVERGEESYGAIKSFRANGSAVMPGLC